MIELNRIRLKFDRLVLNGLNLHVRKGERIGIIGENGAGKSTLLRVIARQQALDSGSVKLDGVELLDPRQKLVPGYDDIQLVGVNTEYDPYLTVAENISGKMTNLRGAIKKKYLNELLELTDLRKLRNQKAGVLSAGERQRLSIGRALACEPDYLLLDEPFVNLDQPSRLKLLQNLLEYQKNFGAGMLFVSHDGAELMGFAERIIHIRRGKIIRDCKACEMYYYPNSIEEGQLMGEINVHRSPKTGTPLFFRPNEYVIDNKGESVELVRVLRAGLLNYFTVKSKKGHLYVLVSVHDLPSKFRFSIKKQPC